MAFPFISRAVNAQLGSRAENVSVQHPQRAPSLPILGALQTDFQIEPDLPSVLSSNRPIFSEAPATACFKLTPLCFRTMG